MRRGGRERGSRQCSVGVTDTTWSRLDPLCEQQSAECCDEWGHLVAVYGVKWPNHLAPRWVLAWGSVLLAAVLAFCLLPRTVTQSAAIPAGAAGERLPGASRRWTFRDLHQPQTLPTDSGLHIPASASASWLPCLPDFDLELHPCWE